MTLSWAIFQSSRSRISKLRWQSWRLASTVLWRVVRSECLANCVVPRIPVRMRVQEKIIPHLLYLGGFESIAILIDKVHTQGVVYNLAIFDHHAINFHGLSGSATGIVGQDTLNCETECFLVSMVSLFSIAFLWSSGRACLALKALRASLRGVGTDLLRLLVASVVCGVVVALSQTLSMAVLIVTGMLGCSPVQFFFSKILQHLPHLASILSSWPEKLKPTPWGCSSQQR